MATSETKCAFQQFTEAESSVLAPFKVSSSILKPPPPPSRLGRKSMHTSEEEWRDAILWFRSHNNHLVQTPRESCSHGYTEYTRSSCCIYGNICTDFVGQQTQVSSQYSKWSTQMARMDSKSWTKKNNLSGNVRGTMAEISTNQPRPPLLHSCGLRSPGHEFMSLRIGSFQIKLRKKTPMSASFLWSLQSNRKHLEVIHKLWEVQGTSLFCAFSSLSSPVVGEASPQEMLQ